VFRGACRLSPFKTLTPNAERVSPRGERILHRGLWGWQLRGWGRAGGSSRVCGRCREAVRRAVVVQILGGRYDAVVSRNCRTRPTILTAASSTQSAATRATHAFAYPFDETCQDRFCSLMFPPSTLLLSVIGFGYSPCCYTLRSISAARPTWSSFFVVLEFSSRKVDRTIYGITESTLKETSRLYIFLSFSLSLYRDGRNRYFKQLECLKNCILFLRRRWSFHRAK